MTVKRGKEEPAKHRLKFKKLLNKYTLVAQQSSESLNGLSFPALGGSLWTENDKHKGGGGEDEKK